MSCENSILAIFVSPPIILDAKNLASTLFWIYFSFMYPCSCRKKLNLAKENVYGNQGRGGRMINNRYVAKSISCYDTVCVCVCVCVC